LKEHPVPDITNLQEIQNKIRSQAERYEQQAMTDAEKSAANSDWHTALALYQEALSRLRTVQSCSKGSSNSCSVRYRALPD